MNERIRELAKEAGCSIDGMGYGEGNIEGFAELIVKECADLVKDFYQEDEFTCYSAAEELKKHFGVEE